MSEQFTCTKCRRTGTRQFETTGDGWTCTAKWACQGRVYEQQARNAETKETTCHKCGRVGVRGFVLDRDVKDREAWMCASWAACMDREWEAKRGGAR